MFYAIITAIIAGSGIWAYYIYTIAKNYTSSHKMLVIFIASVFLAITYFWIIFTLDSSRISFNVDVYNYIGIVLVLKFLSWIRFYEELTYQQS